MVMTTKASVLISAVYLWIHSQAFISNNSSQTAIEIIGRHKFYPLVTFNGIAQEQKPTVRSIYLEYLQIDPTLLLNSLEGCTQLENLTLRNVAWNGFFPRKISLPNLKRYWVLRLEWEFALTTSPDEILSFLHFYTKYSDSTPSVDTEIHFEGELGSNLMYTPSSQKLTLVSDPHSLFQYFTFQELHISGCVFDLDNFNGSGVKKFAEKNIVIKNGDMDNLFQKLVDVTRLDLSTPHEDAIDVSHLPSLEKLEHLIVEGNSIESSSLIPLSLTSLRHLELRDTILNLTSIILPSRTLNTIVFARTSFIGSSYGDLLDTMQNLTRLRLWANDTLFDVATLRKSASTLRSISFRDLNLTQTKPTQFPSLRSLLLGNCSFETSFIKEFTETFQWVKTIIVEWKMERRLWESMLNTSVSKLNLRGYPEYATPWLDEFLRKVHTPLYFDYVELEKVDGEWRQEDVGKGIECNRWVRDAFIFSYTITMSVICIGGILGNLASAIVLLKKSMRSSTSCILLGLTLSDSLVVIAYFPSILFFAFEIAFFFIEFKAGYNHYRFLGIDFTLADILDNDERHRKFFYGLVKTAFTASVYSTVLLTVERYIAVCWPFKAKSWTSIQKSVLASSAVVLFSIFVNFPRWFEAYASFRRARWFWGRDGEMLLVEIQRIPKVGSILRQRVYMEYYQGWLWVILVYVIPIIFISALNLRIWKELHDSRIQRNQMSSRERRGQAENDKDMTAVTSMLTTVTLVFLASSVINAGILIFFVSYVGKEPTEIEGISSIPLIINSSVNFIIYTTMGKKFRVELFNMLPAFCKTSDIGRNLSITDRRSTGVTSASKSSSA